MPDSIFSKIIKRELPATIHYEDDEFIVINDIHPTAPIHVLIITKKQIETLEDIPLEDTEMHAKLLLMARKMAHQLGIQENYKIFLNVGKQVQQIHHIHLHLYGGWKEKKSVQQLNQESLVLINA
jgi:histidine triad (HIT) family protein